MSALEEVEQPLHDALDNGLTFTEGVTLEEVTTQVNSIFVGKEVELQYFYNSTSNVSIDESMLDFTSLDVSVVGTQEIYLDVEGYRESIKIHIRPDFTTANVELTLDILTPEGVFTTEFYDNGYYINSLYFGEYTIEGTKLTAKTHDYGAIYYTLDLTDETNPVANPLNVEGLTKIGQYVMNQYEQTIDISIYEGNIVRIDFGGGMTYVSDCCIENNHLYTMGINFVLHSDGSAEIVE